MYSCVSLRHSLRQLLLVIDILPVLEMSNWPCLILQNWRRIITWGNVLSCEWDKFIFYNPAFVLTGRESARQQRGPAGILSSTHGEERVTGAQRLAITQISASTFCAGLQHGREAGGGNIVEQISPNVNLLGWDSKR